MKSCLAAGFAVCTTGWITAHIAFTEFVADAGAMTTFAGGVIILVGEIRRRRRMAFLEEVVARQHVCELCVKSGEPLNGACPFTEAEAPRDCPKWHPKKPGP